MLRWKRKGLQKSKAPPETDKVESEERPMRIVDVAGERFYVWTVPSLLPKSKKRPRDDK